MFTISEVESLTARGPGAQLVLDPGGHCTFANARYEGLSGVDAEEARGEGWLEHVHSEDRTSLRAALVRVAEDGHPLETELRLVHPESHETRWARLEAARFVNRAGDVVCLVAHVTDVHELVETRRVLAGRARLIQMNDALMQLGHFELRPATKELFWSEEVHRILGTDPVGYEPRFEDHLTFYHPDDRNKIEAEMRQALATGDRYAAEARMVRVTGEIRVVRTAGTPYRCLEREEMEVIGVIQDITEQRTLVARLEESEERYALAEIASQDGIWEWKPSADELWISPRCREILGMGGDSRSSTLMELEQYIHAEDRFAFRDGLNQHVRLRAPFDRECRVVGSDRWIRARGQARWDASGNPTRMVGILADITGQLEARVELERKSEELQRSNSELERFASVASHDLKEPLRKIRAFCDRIQERGKVEDERTLDYLDRMRRAADRLHDLVGDLLEVARVPVLARDRSSVDLGEVARVVVDQLASSISEAGAKVEMGTLPKVRANRLQMEQVLTNLIENALKYRQTDRQPIIALTGGLDPTSGRALLVVEDNGIGFDPEYSERIFMLFERLHGRQYPGTGLGLALCRRVIEEHGGRIEAHGKPNQGARFMVELPSEGR